MAHKRDKTKGRREHGRFIQLPCSILESNEYVNLSAFGVKLLVDVYTQYRGNNNGDLAITWSFMSQRGWKSRDTLYRAIGELLAEGWIVVTRRGGKRKPNLYAVTFRGLDNCEGKLDAGFKANPVPLNTWKKNSLTREPCQINTPPVSKSEGHYVN